jgi:outer membrane biosynthesis protein TonB
MAGEDIVKQVADRVREAIDSAEERADEIVRQAESEAKRIRADAEAAASRRLEEVHKAIDDLQGRLSGAPRSEVTPGPVTVPEPTPPTTPEPGPEPVPEPTPDPVPEPTPDPVPEPAPPPDEADPPSIDPGNGGGDQNAAARLIAMKLALDGTSREEARKRLATDYKLADLDALLDDVYSRAAS